MDFALVGEAIAHVPVGAEHAVHVAELVAAAEHIISELLDRELADALHAHGAEVGHQVQAQVPLFGDHILGADFLFAFEV